MKTSEQKIAQRFVVLAYKRYRMNRKHHFQNLKFFKLELSNKNKDALCSFGYMCESYNHLQLAKEIYYKL